MSRLLFSMLDAAKKMSTKSDYTMTREVETYRLVNAVRFLKSGMVPLSSLKRRTLSQTENECGSARQMIR
jgi:hypothetical protein